VKNQCKQEFAGSDDDASEEFELSFVDDRPIVPLDTRIGDLPAVQRPLHADKLLNVFEVAEQGQRNSVIVFAQSIDAAHSLAARQTWFEQHGKHIGSQLKQTTCELDGKNYVASFAQLLGRVAINTPGRLREVTDEWLCAALERMRTYEEAASDLGFHLALTPTVVSTQVLFGEYYLSPFALLDSTMAESHAALFRNLCSASTLVKTLYWLIGGINLFEEDAEAALLSKWAPDLSTHHAERLKAVIDGRINGTNISHLLSELNKGGQGSEKTPMTVSADSSTDPEKRGLNGIAGRQSIKQTMLRLKAHHGAFSVLLFGPSGCGKTYVAKRLAEELDVMLIRVRPSDIASMFVRESVTRVRGFFDEAVKNKPCMLFFDEFEFLVPDRDRIFPGQEYKIEEINELLIGLELAKEQGVYVIAATNQPFHIDQSIFHGSRFDKIVYIDPPTEQDRIELLQAFLADDALVPNLDLSLIADQLDGFSAADLRTLASAASDVSTSLGRCPISLPILSQALTSIKPSISNETEQRFAKFISKGYEE
jgi:hypothetical protein